MNKEESKAPNKKPMLCRIRQHKWKRVEELSDKASITASVICKDGSEIKASVEHYRCACGAEKTVLSI